jgi:hypothetical protein
MGERYDETKQACAEIERSLLNSGCAIPSPFDTWVRQMFLKLPRQHNTGGRPLGLLPVGSTTSLMQRRSSRIGLAVFGLHILRWVVLQQAFEDGARLNPAGGGVFLAPFFTNSVAMGIPKTNSSTFGTFQLGEFGCRTSPCHVSSTGPYGNT